MFESAKLLRSYIRAIARLSEAQSVSLFVPSSSRSVTNAILIHEGQAPPVPELQDLDQAFRFCEAAYEEINKEKDKIEFALQLPSGSPDSILIRLPTVQSLLLLSAVSGQSTPHKGRRRTDAEDVSWDPAPAAWVGIRFRDGVRSRERTDHERLVPEKPENAQAWWSWILALGGALASHTQQVSELLDDRVTGLPGRTEFQANLAQAMEIARATGSPLTLLLMNPDEFAGVNEQFGREAGDVVLREIADRLRSTIRDTDIVSKYGGAVFAIILHGTMLPGGVQVAEKLLESLIEGPYLGGALRLSFSIGVASFDPAQQGDEQVLNVTRKADQALNAAKRSGGGRCVTWRQSSEMEEVGNLDRLSGIFTADIGKDYRNMVLLWDTVTVVAGSSDFKELSGRVAEKLFSNFKLDCVGLFRWSEGGELQLIHSLVGREYESLHGGTIKLSDEQRSLLKDARVQGRPLQAKLKAQLEASGEGRYSYAIPLLVGDDCLGCLYLGGQETTLALDSSDLIFLQALAGQLAVALDRARLVEQERRRLQAEVKELRQALQLSKLVYRSSQMEAVLTTLRRVAPTDATILVMGESGTGKELLARTIHELSPRRKKRLIVVDCGAIAASLIDSELFGHERGAYTGAQQRRIGRLAEADGGTVLLDEIGELPLEVQSKLLRFVQERQLTPVGGSRSQRVNVRIVAATNRDLAEEVANGRFRQDLFYRLNVVKLVLPPLRERPDDIPHLANHYLKTYSVQYQKPVRRMTAEAEAALLAHGWPGNVRELQNRIMQAMLLCEGEELSTSELGFDTATPPVQPVRSDVASPANATNGRDRIESSAPFLPESPDSGDLWQVLKDALGRQVDESLNNGPPPIALGTCLNEDFVLEAHAVADGVMSRGAVLLGIPETTYRRKLRKAQHQVDSGLSRRPPAWESVRRVVASIIQNHERAPEDLLLRSRELLLEQISARLPRESNRGAALMGVTPLTFRRWLSEDRLNQNELS